MRLTSRCSSKIASRAIACLGIIGSGAATCDKLLRDPQGIGGYGRRGGLTAEEYRWKLIRKWSKE